MRQIPGVRRSDADSCGGAEGRQDAKRQFNSYIKGLCAICTNGDFNKMLELLLRAYSTARNNCMITRSEVAAILDKHVVYEDSEVR